MVFFLQLLVCILTSTSNLKINQIKSEINLTMKLRLPAVKNQKYIFFQNLCSSVSYIFPKENWLFKKVKEKKLCLSRERNTSVKQRKWKEGAFVSKRVHSAGFELQCCCLSSHHTHCYGTPVQASLSVIRVHVRLSLLSQEEEE